MKGIGPKGKRCAAIGTAPVKAPTKFVDRQATKVKPESVAPTEAQPIRMHHRLAGIGK